MPPEIKRKKFFLCQQFYCLTALEFGSLLKKIDSSFLNKSYASAKTGSDHFKNEDETNHHPNWNKPLDSSKTSLLLL